MATVEIDLYPELASAIIRHEMFVWLQMRSGETFCGLLLDDCKHASLETQSSLKLTHGIDDDNFVSLKEAVVSD